MTAVSAAAASLIALLLAVELLLRSSGFGAFPIFERALHGRYRMRPGQAGQFRRRAAWRYDANGMRNDETTPSFAESTLLVGDSVVDGGLVVGQSEMLGSVTAKLCREPFYTVACHGWALANSLAALRALPGWSQAKRLVFVLNTADLDIVGDINNELNFPTRRPAWLTLWLARRQSHRHLAGYRYAREARKQFPPSRVDRAQDVRALNLDAFRELLEEYAGPVFVMRYPMRGADASKEHFFEQLASLSPRVRILEAAEAEGWSPDCYADHIHANAQGLKSLARHLCSELS